MDEDKTREWILDRTADRFYTEGLSGFTMDDVARDAGVSKKTVYRLIPSKNHLIMWVIGRQIDLVEKRQNEIMDDANLAFPDKLDAMVRVVSDLLTRIQRKTVRDIIKRSPDLWEFIRQRRAKVMEGIIRIIEEGRADGMIRGDITPGFLTCYFHQVIDSMVTPLTAMEEDMTLKELLDVTLSIIYGGVLTGKGKDKVHKHREGRQ